MTTTSTPSSGSTPTSRSRSRRGRPRADERAERERQIVAAAMDELIEHGYEGVTMLGVASRAGASKETLYGWFGSKEGLIAALITANADESAARIAAALDAAVESDLDPRDTLVDYSIGLLSLLTSPASIALNRAAMSSPELAATLLAHGRHRVGPLVERYLDRLSELGHLALDDAAESFELLYGLVVRDAQIRCLLGEAPPAPDDIRRAAERAVDRFVDLSAS